MSYNVTWESPAGEILELSLGNDPKQGYWVREAEGFVSELEVSSVIRATGVGEDIQGFAVPSMVGSFEVVIAPETAGTMLSMPQMYSRLIRQFSQLRHGRMSWSQPDGQVLTSHFRLASGIPAPQWNPHTMGGGVFETSISFVSESGVWDGRTDWGVETPGGARRLLNAGDLPAFVDIDFTGGSVSIDGASPVTLPAVSGTRRLSTDPGTGYKISDPAMGQVDVDAWASMRGRPVPGRVEPGQMVMVETTGDVSVSLTPRFTTPWR